MCELSRDENHFYIVKGVISHCWERKVELRTRKNQPMMARKSSLRCRRARSYCHMGRSAKPGDGSKDREWEEKSKVTKPESQEVPPPKLGNIVTSRYSVVRWNRAGLVKWNRFLKRVYYPGLDHVMSIAEEIQSAFPNLLTWFHVSKTYRRITVSVWQPTVPARSK